MRTRLGEVVVSAVLAASLLVSPVAANQSRPSSQSASPSPTPACTRPKPGREPRKIVHRVAKLSAKAQATTTHGGVLIYDAVIDERGFVRDLKLLRPVASKEPWPELEAAWRTAMSEWQYEPTLVDGKPVRVCMTVSLLIHVR